MDELYTMERLRQMLVFPNAALARILGKGGALAKGRVARYRHKIRRTAPLGSSAIDAATSECYLRPIE